MTGRKTRLYECDKYQKFHMKHTYIVWYEVFSYY